MAGEENNCVSPSADVSSQQTADLTAENKSHTPLHSDHEISSNGSLTPKDYGSMTTNGTNDSAQAALQRGLEALKNTEVDTNIEEIKKLDSQIDHFHTYLDKFEAKNNELNQKLTALLEAQKEERSKRRASLQQRDAENKEQSDALHDQMQALLSRCHMARRVSVAEISHTMEPNGALESLPVAKGERE